MQPFMGDPQEQLYLKQKLKEDLQQAQMQAQTYGLLVIALADRLKDEKGTVRLTKKQVDAARELKVDLNTNKAGAVIIKVSES